MGFLHSSSHITSLALQASPQVIKGSAQNAGPQRSPAAPAPPPPDPVQKPDASSSDLWVGPPTFRELFTKTLNDVIDFIALLHSLETLCAEDDWAIASAMELDLLSLISKDTAKQVMMTTEAIGDQCIPGTLGFHAWKRVGKKILERTLAQGFIMTQITSIGERQIKSAEKGEWFNVYYAFAEHEDQIGIWETCYIIRTPDMFPIGNVMLVPHPRHRPITWTKDDIEPGTEVPSRSIPVHPALVPNSRI